jgi:sugar phosphate permease
LLVTCVGVGGLAGTATLAVFAGYFRRRGALLLGGIALYGALFILFSLSNSMFVSVPILLLVGVFQFWYLTSAQTLIQVLIPDELRGRVMATYTFTWSLIPVRGAIMGALAALFGPTTAVAIGGSILLLSTLACALRVPEVLRLR